MSEQANEDQVLPLADIALNMVRRAEDGAPERLVLHPKGPEVIRAGVKALLLSGASNDEKLQALRRTVALCCILDERESAPAAASAVFEALVSHPDVPGLLRRRDGRQTTKRYRQFVDDRDVERAPQVDAAAPDGSLKLHALLNPGQERAKPGANKPDGSATAPRPRAAGQRPGTERVENNTKDAPDRPSRPLRRGGFDT